MEWLLQGYLLGNAMTTRKENNYAIPFAHGMGLISDELYKVISKLNYNSLIHIQN